MKIAVLHSSSYESIVPFRQLDPPCNPAPYLPEHQFEHVTISKSHTFRQIADVARAGFDVVVNLCDGALDEDTAGIDVVRALERFNLAFTGAGSSFYDPSRLAMKMACHAAGIRFPAYVIATCPSHADNALSSLRFPMIVKHPQGYSSTGITRDSRVADEASLRREIGRIICEFGAALVEEFIEGREFTVLVAEPRHEGEDAWALDPVEFRFPTGESFRHFNLKWKDYKGMEAMTVSDATLAARLRGIASLAFVGLGGSGYGRCDLRMDSSGAIFLLEINPNCGVFYPDGEFGSADFILANDPASHRDFLTHIIDCGIRRRSRLHRVWEIRFAPEQGFGMFAAEAIREGDVVQRNEEGTHTLVSRSYGEQHWRGLRRRWFDEYSWPLSANVHAIWDANPDAWRPLNHSCDPNTWLSGLNVAARRDISPGEELTIDYATYCGPAMSSFQCHCRASECRNTITENDCLIPGFERRYAGHLSGFVERCLRDAPAFFVLDTSLGSGLIARRAWSRNDKIADLHWTCLSPQPSRWTLQCDESIHAKPVPSVLQYVNHSCSPNVQFDMDENVFRALKDIEPGEELRCFYPATEWSMAEPFACNCGAPQCLGSVTGAEQVSPKVLGLYALSAFVRRSLSR